jgi:hypothetical protein
MSSSKVYNPPDAEYVANLYAEQMLCWKQGHALWQPSRVRIGDVGRLIEGRFHCLFNLLQGAPQIARPEHRFEPLKLEPNHYIFHGDKLPVGPFPSHSLRKVKIDTSLEGSMYVWVLLSRHGLADM